MGSKTEGGTGAGDRTSSHAFWKCPIPIGCSLTRQTPIEEPFRDRITSHIRVWDSFLRCLDVVSGLTSSLGAGTWTARKVYTRTRTRQAAPHHGIPTTTDFVPILFLLRLWHDTGTFPYACCANGGVRVCFSDSEDPAVTLRPEVKLVLAWVTAGTPREYAGSGDRPGTPLNTPPPHHEN